MKRRTQRSRLANLQKARACRVNKGGHRRSCSGVSPDSLLVSPPAKLKREGKKPILFTFSSVKQPPLRKLPPRKPARTSIRKEENRKWMAVLTLTQEANKGSTTNSSKFCSVFLEKCCLTISCRGG